MLCLACWAGLESLWAHRCGRRETWAAVDRRVTTAKRAEALQDAPKETLEGRCSCPAAREQRTLL